MWTALGLLLAATAFTPPAHALNMTSLPTGARFGLWSLTSGAMLRHSESPPLYARFGTRPANVSGGLVKPPLDGLCSWSEEMRAWNGRVLLGGEWSAGCSIEQRSRVFSTAGVAAAIFSGTEGLPLDWDGSDVSSIDVPVMVISSSLYYALAADLDASANLTVWLAPEDTPLLHDTGFIVVDRLLQVLFFLGASANVFLAIYQLARFYIVGKKLAKTSASLNSGAAVTVIGLELISSLAMVLFIVDGPGMEHTRPVLLPWLVHRLALGFQTSFHMLALLFSSKHLRKIRRRVEDTSSHSKRSSIDVGRSGSIDLGSGTSLRRFNCTFRVSSRWDGIVTFSITSLVVLDLVSAFLTGLYIPSPDFTFLAATYIALVTLGIGCWFVWQASIISGKLKKAQGSHRRVDRLSKNSKRIGIVTVIGCIFGAIAEVVINPMLKESGGWTFWWVMMFMWCVMEGFMLIASTQQILAFQPPADPAKKASPSRASVENGAAARRPMGGGRWSVSNVFLNDVVKMVTGAPATKTNSPATVKVGPEVGDMRSFARKKDDLRDSNAGSDAGSVQSSTADSAEPPQQA